MLPVFLKLMNVTLQNEHTSWLYSRLNFLISDLQICFTMVYFKRLVCRYFWRTSQPFCVKELYWFYWACTLILYGAHSMPRGNSRIIISLQLPRCEVQSETSATKRWFLHDLHTTFSNYHAHTPSVMHFSAYNWLLPRAHAQGVK